MVMSYGFGGSTLNMKYLGDSLLPLFEAPYSADASFGTSSNFQVSMGRVVICRGSESLGGLTNWLVEYYGPDKKGRLATTNYPSGVATTDVQAMVDAAGNVYVSCGATTTTREWLSSWKGILQLGDTQIVAPTGKRAWTTSRGGLGAQIYGDKGGNRNCTYAMRTDLGAQIIVPMVNTTVFTASYGYFRLDTLNYPPYPLPPDYGYDNTTTQLQNTCPIDGINYTLTKSNIGARCGLTSWELSTTSCLTKSTNIIRTDDPTADALLVSGDWSATSGVPGQGFLMRLGGLAQPYFLSIRDRTLRRIVFAPQTPSVRTFLATNPLASKQIDSDGIIYTTAFGGGKIFYTYGAPQFFFPASTFVPPPIGLPCIPCSIPE